MNLPFTKCTKCGRSTLTDEYCLSGCQQCGDTSSGVDYGSYKRREHLSTMEGVNVFHGRFRKVGNLHYQNRKKVVLVENIKCGTDDMVTGHAYITDASPNTIEMLKMMKPGTDIQFKARVHQYDPVHRKWGFDHMCHVVPIGI